MEIVKAVEKSVNSKTGLVSVTYAPIHSCPKSCAFLNSGCYAQTGHCGIHLNRLNTTAEKYKVVRPIDIAKREANAINDLSGERPLRLHIVGDCRTPKAAEVVAQAAYRYTKKQGQPVWTYTHAWKEIPREKWGSISVLASCETIEEAKHAMSRGYAASIVRLKEFQRPFIWKDLVMMPCPEMTIGTKCNKCKLCFNDKRLLEKKRVICFFPHGSQQYHAKEAIRRKEGFK
jgi:hypothetical protein